jgi:type II secretory pathway pseudopilin PulG
MARGFLLFEILIALAVMSITMTALSLSAFGLPLIAKNAEIKLTALQEAFLYLYVNE